MKLRFSPVAAAVLMVTGLFTSGLRAASPDAIPFDNDASFTVALSNTNPNKIIIDGELVTSISGPTGAYDQSTTPDGALILSPLTAQNFTVFLQTDRGASVSLNIQPKPVAGRTLRFTPLSVKAHINEDAKAWEEGQSYEKTLVTLSRAITNGDVPDNYEELPISSMPAYIPNVAIKLTAERQFVGSHLRVVRFRMRNAGYVTVPLRERDFWRKGVRGVMLSQNQLYAGGEGFVWVIFSDDGVPTL
jgi:conjugal transfer pilus assembly protein TraK